MPDSVASVVVDDGQSLCSWVFVNSEEAGSATFALAHSLDSSIIAVDAAREQTAHADDLLQIERHLAGCSVETEALSSSLIGSDVLGIRPPEHVEIEGEGVSPPPSDSRGTSVGQDEDYGLGQMPVAGQQNVLERVFWPDAALSFDAFRLSAEGSETGEDGGDSRIVLEPSFAHHSFGPLDAMVELNQPPPLAAPGESVSDNRDCQVALWLMAVGMTSSSERSINYRLLVAQLEEHRLYQQVPNYPERVMLAYTTADDPQDCVAVIGEEIGRVPLAEYTMVGDE